MFVYVALDKDVCQNVEVVYVLHLYVSIFLSATLVSAHFPHPLPVKLNHTPLSAFRPGTSLTAVVISLISLTLTDDINDICKVSLQLT